MHIYAQSTSHEDVVIVGDLSALQALRDAISKAIERNDSAACGVFCEDREGYNIIVKLGKTESLRLPYFDSELHPSLDGDFPYFSLVEIRTLQNEAWENFDKN